ncbi:integrin alpha-7 isoform X1 [Acipenser ruthenus]|uniref:integrin alpha-7-like isoform X1 n=1 Tax=Acipenser ruthenus TaxID=7906 RepID=UPI0027418677|nr:integrin alpha-7-like isoform X1 [Acipenser ruthenus]XP_058869469.1 integrin alpha-7 isoform X1 [Acipenser ruthenus]
MSWSWAALLFVLWALHACPPLGSGFNLDVTETIAKDGERGSLFGFSVALHKQLTPEPKSWILVGAPQARGLPSQGANHTGALYQCPITGEEWDCERVDIDEDVDLERESKENQWLGVTVKSQGVGGKVVACAHLYELRQRFRQPSETRDPIGRCYVLSEDLTVRDDLDGGEWKFCEGRPQGHEQFGFCQQGMAAGFTPDNSYILFGAPGTYHWKGELRLQLVNLTGLDRGVFDDGPYEVADEKLQDSRLIPLQYNSYLGFSVDSAHGITSPQELSFVAGAPRANHRGAVVLLKKDNVYRLVPEHILWGSEVASSFGYSVAVADLNNDGWTDLVVGAPNVFDRKAEIGGAVYVYINPSGLWKHASPVRLNGTYDSMFGLTVASVGDLNQDGFADIAVGAPFDGDGKVYIYHGSAYGINTKPAQVLDGEGVGVKLFGYSLSGGMDIDGNSYPDLVVGSLSDSVVLYRARPVIHVLREISVQPQNIDLEQKNCRGRDGVCVEVKACFIYTAQPKTYNPQITLSVMFEADSERRKLGLPHRVNFLGRRSSEPEYQRSEEVELRGQHARACQSAIFQLQDSLRDKLSPISVSASYSIKQTRHSNQPTNKLGALSPVLNAALPSTLRTEVNFLREGCGDDKICQSNLQLSYRFGTRATTTDLFTPLAVDMEGMPVFSLSDQKTVALEVTVTNLPSDPRQSQKDGDDAHAAQLLVGVPETLSYSGFRGPQDKQLVCAANPNGSYAECELGNPMKRNAKVTFYIILSTSAITIETTDLTVNLQLLTISEQPDLQPIVARARVVIELPLSVTGMAVPHQLFFSGTTKGESAMTSQEDVGSAVEYKFTVTNPGQSLQTLGSAFLNVMWPHELSNGKWLLYPTGMYFKGDRNTHCSTSQPLNPLRLTDYHNLPGQTDYHSRKGRSNQEKSRIQTQGIVGRTTPAVSASERRKLLTLDCLLGSARCILFQCPLHSFDGSAELTVHARLWNSTFLEDFPSVSALELLVRANITVKSTIKHLELRNAAAQISVMVYPEHAVSDHTGVPWWIILIAILAGILMLALLVCLLWKCGFFKRAQYTDTVPQYHAVKIPKQDRPQFKDEKTGTLHKKEWATHWSDRDGA